MKRNRIQSYFRKKHIHTWQVVILAFFSLGIVLYLFVARLSVTSQSLTLQSQASEVYESEELESEPSMLDSILTCMTEDMDVNCRDEVYAEIPFCYEAFETQLWRTDLRDEQAQNKLMDGFRLCLEGRIQETCGKQLGDNINSCIDTAIENAIQSLFSFAFEEDPSPTPEEREADKMDTSPFPDLIISPTPELSSISQEKPVTDEVSENQEQIVQCLPRSRNACCGLRSYCHGGNYLTELTNFSPSCTECAGISEVCIDGSGCVLQNCSSLSEIYTREDGTCMACFISKHHNPGKGQYFGVESVICEKKQEDPDFKVGWKTFAEYALTEDDRYKVRNQGFLIYMNDPATAWSDKLLTLYQGSTDTAFYNLGKIGRWFSQSLDFYTLGLFGERDPQPFNYYNELAHTNLEAEREAARRGEERPSFLKRFGVNVATGVPTVLNSSLLGIPNVVTGGGVDKLNNSILTSAYGDNEAEKSASRVTTEASSVVTDMLTIVMPGDFAVRSGARAARALPNVLETSHGIDALTDIPPINSSTIDSIRGGTEMSAGRDVINQGQGIKKTFQFLTGKDTFVGSATDLYDASVGQPLTRMAQQGGETVQRVVPAPMNPSPGNRGMFSWIDDLFSGSKAAPRIPRLQKGQEVIIGRDPKVAKVAFPNESAMSAQHFAYGIHPQSNNPYIRDLGSRNGTRVNGEEVRTNGRYVQPGDVVEVDTASGEVEQFVIDDGYNLVNVNRQRQVVQGSSGSASRRTTGTERAGNVAVARPGQEVIIGRDPSKSHVSLNSNLVSRQHLAYGTHPTSGRAYIRDLGSRNGSYLNGELIDNRGVYVQPGDRIRLGGDYSDIELLIDQQGNLVDVRDWRVVAKPDYNYRTIENTANGGNSQRENVSTNQGSRSDQGVSSSGSRVSVDSSHSIRDAHINMGNRSGGHPNQDAVAPPIDIVVGQNQKYRIGATADGVSTARGGGGISRDSARVAQEAAQNAQSFLHEELLRGTDPQTAIRYALERTNNSIRAGDGAAAVNLYVVDQTARRIHVGNVGDGVVLLVSPGSNRIQVLNYWDMFDTPIVSFLDGRNQYGRAFSLEEALRLPGASSVNGVVGQSHILPHIRSHTLPDGDFYIVSASDQLYKMLAHDIRPVAGSDWDITSPVLAKAAQDARGDPNRFIQAVNRYNDGGDDLGLVVEGYQARSRNARNQRSPSPDQQAQRVARQQQYSFEQVQDSVDKVLERYPHLQKEGIYVPFREEEMAFFLQKLKEVEGCVQRSSACRPGLRELYTHRAKRMFNQTDIRRLREEEKIFLATRAYAVELNIPSGNLQVIVGETNTRLQKYVRRAQQMKGRLSGNPLETNPDVAVIKSGTETLRLGYQHSNANGLGIGVDEILLNYDNLARHSLEYQYHVYMHEKIHSIQMAANGGSLRGLSDVYRVHAKDSSWVEVFTQWLTLSEADLMRKAGKLSTYDRGVLRLDQFIQNGLQHGYIRERDLQRFVDAAITGDFNPLRNWLRSEFGTDLPHILGNTSDYDFYHGTYN